jgi:glutamate-1-semialdehyde aminotransferase
VSIFFTHSLYISSNCSLCPVVESPHLCIPSSQSVAIILFDKVKGAYAWGVDNGNRFIDYVGTWAPTILGHEDDVVLDVGKKTIDKGELATACAKIWNISTKTC